MAFHNAYIANVISKVMCFIISHNHKIHKVFNIANLLLSYFACLLIRITFYINLNTNLKIFISLMLNLFSYLLLLQSFSEEKYTIGDEAQTFSTKMKKGQDN